MDLRVDASAVLSFFFSTVSSLWPLWIISMVTISKRRSQISSWQILWIVLVISWLGARFLPGDGLSIIPEPTNSILFWLVALAAAVFFASRLLRHPMRDHILNPEFDPKADIDHEGFEKYVAEIFRLSGHKVQIHGRQRDHGIDLIIHLKNGEKWVTQCKQWSGAVGEPAVRDLFGAMHHAKADRAALITTGSFTSQARTWAKGKPIELIDGQRLKKISAKISRERHKKTRSL